MVLVANAINVESLKTAKSSNETSGAMLSLVAMDENRMVGAIKKDVEGTVDIAALDPNLALVGVDVYLEMLDAGLFRKGLIFGRNLLGDKGNNGLQLQALQEFKVLLLWIAASIHGTGYDSAVVARREQATEASGGKSLGNGRRGAGFGLVDVLS